LTLLLHYFLHHFQATREDMQPRELLLLLKPELCSMLQAICTNSTSIATYAPGFAHPELLGYTTGTQAARWTAAKAAAKAVI